MIDRSNAEKSCKLRPIDAESMPQPRALEAVIEPLTRRRVGYVLTRRPTRRIWSGLSPVQKRAADYIARGVEGYASRLGISTVRLSERLDTGVADDTWLLDFVADYNRWADACRDYRISRHAVVDVLVRGEPLRRVERAHRRRNGWARQNLTDGVQLFCDLKRWR